MDFCEKALPIAAALREAGAVAAHDEGRDRPGSDETTGLAAGATTASNEEGASVSKNFDIRSPHSSLASFSFTTISPIDVGLGIHHCRVWHRLFIFSIESSFAFFSIVVNCRSTNYGVWQLGSAFPIQG